MSHSKLHLLRGFPSPRFKKASPRTLQDLPQDAATDRHQRQLQQGFGRLGWVGDSGNHGKTLVNMWTVKIYGKQTGLPNMLNFVKWLCQICRIIFILAGKQLAKDGDKENWPWLIKMYWWLSKLQKMVKWWVAITIQTGKCMQMQNNMEKTLLTGHIDSPRPRKGSETHSNPSPVVRGLHLRNEKSIIWRKTLEADQCLQPFYNLTLYSNSTYTLYSHLLRKP